MGQVGKPAVVVVTEGCDRDGCNNIFHGLAFTSLAFCDSFIHQQHRELLESAIILANSKPHSRVRSPWLLNIRSAALGKPQGTLLPRPLTDTTEQLVIEAGDVFVAPLLPVRIRLYRMIMM